MTMECRDVRTHILESFDGTTAQGADAAIATHLEDCPACSAFARRQAALDARLVQALAPPALDAAFRSSLEARIRKEPKPSRADGLLELVHFASCGLAIVVLALILPVSSVLVVAVGLTAALAAYVALSIVRGSFEDELLER
jgi:predicted anti-sigma-YlaC factor YlaD